MTGDERLDAMLDAVSRDEDASVFARRAFDADERHVSGALETAMRLFESFADDVGQCRERQVAMERAHEALFWARRAIVVAGVR